MQVSEAKQLMSEASKLAAWGRQNGLIAEARRTSATTEKIGPFPVRVWEQPDHTWRGICEGLRAVGDTQQEAAIAAGTKHITKVLRRVGRGTRVATVEPVSPGMWRAWVAL
jgi:hypothetical protein